MAMRKDAAEMATSRALARTRRRVEQTLRSLRKRGTLSADAADMIQAELDVYASVDLYWDAHEGRWFVYSGFDEHRYGLAEYEALCARYAARDQRGLAKVQPKQRG